MSRNNKLPWWLKPEDWKIVGFYPYTTYTFHRLFEAKWDRKGDDADSIREFTHHFKKIAEEKLNIQWDNKVVLKIERVDTWGDNETHAEYAPLYLGYKDGSVSIALGIYQQSKCTTSLNKTFV